MTVTHLMLQRSLKVYWLNHSLSDRCSVGSHCVLWHPRSALYPAGSAHPPFSITTYLDSTHQLMYSLGIVSGLIKNANMICPQHSPNSKISPCGICMP